MKSHTMTMVMMFAAALLCANGAPASAAKGTQGTAAFDKAMQPILAVYLQVHDALARDTVAGVKGKAKRIAALTVALAKAKVAGKHAAHYAGVPSKLRANAKKLAAAGSLKAAREAFKLLSRPMAMWATMSKPASVHVVFCSMVKGSWLQKDKAVRNPYHGKKMLRCGQIIGGASKGHGGKHAH